MSMIRVKYTYQSCCLNFHAERICGCFVLLDQAAAFCYAIVGCGFSGLLEGVISARRLID